MSDQKPAAGPALAAPVPPAGSPPPARAVPPAPAARTMAVDDGGPTSEVRFAVVMYGGVSLCIYMNGIAQELLHMVRATAGDDTGLRYADDKLTRIERVYRQLGRLVDAERAPGEPARDGRVRARFSVDILSGTSAGGINSIFLAKALANDERMAQLKQLWMTEADIGRLINDAGSLRDTGLAAGDGPQSLLNGQRMYQKLVQAFEGMDEEVGVQNDAPPRPPLVPELDLFVTATDIAGVPLPLRLSDGVVHERRHRGVFNFRFKHDGVDGAHPNHFSRRYNPFLAFAARCTSAFPFAFQPMRLDDINPVLDTFDAYRGQREGRADDPRWAPFLERFRTPPGTAQVDPVVRAFGDGGYLDNKPFSYASETLLRREAGIPVARKLIYIEPAPEHPERDRARTDRPDAIENTLAAAVGLPRYETIREDLERLMARNRLTERVRTITQALEDDIPSARHRQALEAPTDWGNRYLEDMVADHGLAYGSYHRLRVAAATDWLAGVVCRAAGLGDDSDRVLAVRHLVRAWRDRLYAPHRGQRQSENRFLLDYDLSFRMRRVGYLLGKANWLHGFDRQAQVAVQQILSRALKEQQAGVLAPLAGRPLTEDEKGEWREEIIALKRAFHTPYTAMRHAQEAMDARAAESPFHAQVQALGLRPEELTGMLRLSGEARDTEAQMLLEQGTRQAALEAFAEQVKGAIRAARQGSSNEVDRLLDSRTAAPAPSPVRQLARRVLWHYYHHYGDYDMVSFPILYSTDAGEQETVDVIRISPEDARYVLDERSDALGRRKLAGTAVFNFGGFLQDTWRSNDILWGRLDGAERIICALLPHAADEALRSALLEEASLAILEEEFQGATRKEVSRLMSESLVSVAAGRSPRSAVARLAGRIGNAQLPTRLEAVFGNCLNDRELLRYFREGYEVNRELDPQTALGALARGSRVVGQMLEGITERHNREASRVRWLTRAGSWFWSLVQVAVPRSLPALLFDHWLGLLYTLSVMMIVVGVLAGPEVMGWGVRLLLASLGAHGVVLLLRDFMRRRGVVAAVGAAVAAGAVWGLVIAFGWWAAHLRPTRQLLGTVRNAVGLDAWTGLPTVQALCGLLGAAILLVTVPALLRKPWRGLLPGGYASPMLAAEFVGSAEDLATLTRGAVVPPPPAVVPGVDDAALARIRERQGRLPVQIRTGLYVDYLFIAAYWLLFLLLADRLVDRANLLYPEWTDWALLWAGLLAGVAGTAAALLDLVENGRIHEAFTAGRGREEDWMALGIRWAAAWKWGMVFVTVLLLAPLFLVTGGAAHRVLGVGWMAVAGCGLWAVMRRPRVLELAFPALGVGLLAAAYLLGRG